MAASNTQIILNITEGTYFSFKKEYEKILNTLFEKDVNGNSRWLRSDKIIFVPDHLRKYVRENYEKVFA